MDANELELRKYLSKTERILSLTALGGKAVKGTVWLLSIYLILTGLKPYIGEDISSLIVVVDAIKKTKPALSGSVLLNLVLGVLWWKEKRGKRRAIKLKAKFQKQVEAKDEFRSSSELTEIGTTPKEENEND